MTTSDPRSLLAKNLTKHEWVKKLNGTWDDLVDLAVTGFFKLGDYLLQAKIDVEHGEWQAMLEKELKFNASTARIFMRLATKRNQNESFDHVLPLLPPDYNTIDKLLRLESPKLKELVDNGTVCPTLQRNEVSKILRLERVKADEKRVLSLRPRPGKYKTLVIDPAWDYEWLSIAARAKPGYHMQSPDELRALDLKQWAEPECQLWCWTTNNFMYEACKLVEHWGFQHRTVLTWVKPPPFGLGSYLRNSTEHCIFATLGETTTRPAAASIPTHFFAPRGEHSEKPEEFYEIVRAASYPPYGEGNQIKIRPDFTDLFMSGDALAA